MSLMGLSGFGEFGEEGKEEESISKLMVTLSEISMLPIGTVPS